MLFGFLNPFRMALSFRLHAARKRCRKKAGPKDVMELAQLLVRSGDRAAALRELQKGLIASPRAVELRKLHDSLWAEIAGAEIKALEKITRSGGEVQDFARLIELYRSLKRFDRCIAVAQAAEKKFSDSWVLKLAAGKALYHRFVSTRTPEDGRKAADVLRQVVRKKADCSRAWLYLAALLAELGQQAEAAQAADELVRLAPGNERARKLHTRLHGASAAGKHRKQAAAGRPRAGAEGDLLAGFMAKLRENSAVMGAVVFDGEGAVADRYSVKNDLFALEGHESTLSALGKCAGGAADRMGIGRLRLCVIEGEEWRMFFAQVAGGTVAVLATRAFSASAFESMAGRFSLDCVKR